MPICSQGVCRKLYIPLRTVCPAAISSCFLSSSRCIIFRRSILTPGLYPIPRRRRISVDEYYPVQSPGMRQATYRKSDKTGNVSRKRRSYEASERDSAGRAAIFLYGVWKEHHCTVLAGGSVDAGFRSC